MGDITKLRRELTKLSETQEKEAGEVIAKLRRENAKRARKVAREALAWHPKQKVLKHT